MSHARGPFDGFTVVYDAALAADLDPAAAAHADEEAELGADLRRHQGARREGQLGDPCAR
jgi:hypothetical protein